MIRLQRFLAEAGTLSRRQADEWIAMGRVIVNGRVAEPGTTVDPEKDHVQVDGERVQKSRHHIVLMMHKPRGVVCSEKDPEGRRNAHSLLPELPVRVHTVGRLDMMSEGLLLFTNDGDLTRQLTRSASGFERVYEVKIQGGVPAWAMERLERGVNLEDGRARAASCKRLRLARTNEWLEVVMTEGRYREVRRMFQTLGMNVLKLKRVRFGPLRLGKLPIGAVRNLTPDEITALVENRPPKAVRPPKNRPTPRGARADRGGRSEALEKPGRTPRQGAPAAGKPGARPGRGQPNERDARRPGARQQQDAPTPDAYGIDQAPRRDARAPGRPESSRGPHRDSRAPARPEADRGPHRDGGAPARSEAARGPHRDSRAPARPEASRGPHRDSGAQTRPSVETGPRRSTRTPQPAAAGRGSFRDADSSRRPAAGRPSRPVSDRGIESGPPEKRFQKQVDDAVRKAEELKGGKPGRSPHDTEPATSRTSPASRTSPTSRGSTTSRASATSRPAARSSDRTGKAPSRGSADRGGAAGGGSRSTKPAAGSSRPANRTAKGGARTPRFGSAAARPSTRTPKPSTRSSKPTKRPAKPAGRPQRSIHANKPQKV